MNEAQRIAFFSAQIVCAQAEIESMKAANVAREAQGYAQAYGEEAFREVVNKYGLGHNDAITFLKGD